MKRKFAILLGAVLSLPSALMAYGHGNSGDVHEWKLEWVEEFDSTALDAAVWSRTKRGGADWAKMQSDDPRCVEFRDGTIVLRGIVNDKRGRDSSPYLCGGIYTKGKKAFAPGRIEVRARLHGARAAWPAIWLLPFDMEKHRWPNGGEIDIMERLNYDRMVYQTVHSHYTHDLKHTTDPRNSGVYTIDPDGWNVYGVDVFPDYVQFYVNGQPTLYYPRIETDEQGQFPFYCQYYLLIDMQLGGKWVESEGGGGVIRSELPVEMEVDWVKYYLPVD